VPPFPPNSSRPHDTTNRDYLSPRLEVALPGRRARPIDGPSSVKSSRIPRGAGRGGQGGRMKTSASFNMPSRKSVTEHFEMPKSRDDPSKAKHALGSSAPPGRIGRNEGLHCGSA
jgi:hypothetical protein